jgi:hypothetical protein
MFVGEEDPVELVGLDSALFKTRNQLPRTQAAIDKQPAMIGRDQRAVSCTSASEHSQTEHDPISNGRALDSQMEIAPLEELPRTTG